MQQMGKPSSYGLDDLGLEKLGDVFWNLSPSQLVEQIIRRKEGYLSHSGAVITQTGKHTGRTPKDKYIVKSGAAIDLVYWGKINQPIEKKVFQAIFKDTLIYFHNRDIFIQDLEVGADKSYQMPIRVITEKAWHSLFSYNLFIRPPEDVRNSQIPQITVLHAPDLHLTPDKYGIHSDTFIGIDFESRLILIAGSGYAGEIKKSVFSMMNYFLPQKSALPMHCSANIGQSEDTALFFGLSGTGKTTLSSDPDRSLIGDDEHGWSENGVFNFEGGCYAKTIHLRKELEPLIWDASLSFGSVLENVTFNMDTRIIDFDDAAITENTRSAYALDKIPGHVESGQGIHPKNIFFLCADAFGVIPPIAKLTPEQAIYYFLSGYTSKLAGTEDGLGKEPQATFSSCFGAPFLPIHPTVYARLLDEKIKKHHAQVWLVNTGWSGGPVGTGERIKLPFTRAMIQAALTGELNTAVYIKDDYFGLDIPTTCPNVPPDVLNPIKTWLDATLYAKQAKNLITLFNKNYEQFLNFTHAQIFV